MRSITAFCGNSSNSRKRRRVCIAHSPASFDIGLYTWPLAIHTIITKLYHMSELPVDLAWYSYRANLCHGNTNADKLVEQLNDMSLPRKPVRPALKSRGRSSSTRSPKTPSSSEATTPLETKKCVGWANSFADVKSRKRIIGHLLDIYEYDGSDKEREWKRSGGVKKWKVSMRLKRKDMLGWWKMTRGRFLRREKEEEEAANVRGNKIALEELRLCCFRELANYTYQKVPHQWKEICSAIAILNWSSFDPWKTELDCGSSKVYQSGRLWLLF